MKQQAAATCHMPHVVGRCCCCCITLHYQQQVTLQSLPPPPRATVSALHTQTHVSVCVCLHFPYTAYIFMAFPFYHIFSLCSLFFSAAFAFCLTWLVVMLVMECQSIVPAIHPPSQVKGYPLLAIVCINSFFFLGKQCAWKFLKQTRALRVVQLNQSVTRTTSSPPPALHMPHLF